MATRRISAPSLWAALPWELRKFSRPLPALPAGAKVRTLSPDLFDHGRQSISWPVIAGTKAGYRPGRDR